MPAFSDELRATLYEPSGPLQGLMPFLDQTPRYLYRTHSPKSSGTTTATFVASSGAEHNYVDILQQERSLAKSMLSRHVTVWDRGEEDNLMSWTSSLLFALQHAIRREKTDRPSPSARQVKISILDTSRIHRACFMPSVEMLDAYDVPNVPGGLTRDHYHGEYLSQGRLDIPEGAMVTFTLQDLTDHGLYGFYPEFADEAAKGRLCKRVTELRQPFRHLDYGHELQVCSSEEVDLAAAMAEGCCADPSFRLVIFASLLALKPRDQRDSKVLKKFEQLRWSWGAVPDNITASRERTSSRVPEHKQFVTMMRALHLRQKELEVIFKSAVEDAKEPDKDVTDEMSRLQISSSRITSHEKYSDLTLNVNVAFTKYEPGLISLSTATLPMLSTEPPKKTLSRKHVYINRLVDDETQIDEAVKQVTKYGMNSGPCHECCHSISQTCLRKGCFQWCSVHARMLNQRVKCSGYNSKTKDGRVECCIVGSVLLLSERA